MGEHRSVAKKRKRTVTGEGRLPRPGGNSRRCGPCHACCDIPEIPELDKPRYVGCKYGLFTTIPGDRSSRPVITPPENATGCCGVYNDPVRPAICSEYKCWWLFGSHLDLVMDEDRPDKCGLVLEIVKASRVSAMIGLPIITAHEIWEGAASEPHGAEILGRIADRALVIVVWKDERRLLGPPNAVRVVMDVYRAAL
jgi:hypothetical protein